jgi:hypothetical protein
MNKLLYIACFITRSDPDLAQVSNKLDRSTIIWNAIALLTVSLIAVIAWTAFFASFLPIWAALPLGILLGAIIFQLDQAMGASDWEIAGVLRTEPLSKAYWGRLTLRVLVALLLAQATAVGLTLCLFDGAINNQLQEQRTDKNAAVDRRYEGLKSEFKARTVTPVEEELKAAQETRSQTLSNIRHARSALDEAQEVAKTARMEAGREADGLGRPEGEGDNWREALRQEDEANRTITRAQERIRSDESRLSEIDTSIVQLTQTLDARNKELNDRERTLDNEKVRDGEWVPERNDPMLRILALWEIEKNSTYGPVAKDFDFGAKVLLVTLELMFFLVKIVFAPTSVYTVRLIARTKAEAASISAEYARDVETIRRGRPRGSLRIVGGRDESNPSNHNPNSDGDQP